MQVRAVQKVYYAGRDRNPGEVFEMDDRQYTDINILCVLGKIEKIAAQAAEPPPSYQTADIVAEEAKPPTKNQGVPVVETESDPEQPQRRRYYRRRDMKAEQ